MGGGASAAELCRNLRRRQRSKGFVFRLLLNPCRLDRSAGGQTTMSLSCVLSVGVHPATEHQPSTKEAAKVRWRLVNDGSPLFILQPGQPNLVGHRDLNNGHTV